MENKKWWNSSVNPQKISLTLKSFIPLVIFGLGFFGIASISESDLVGLAEAIGTFVSAGFLLFGLGRKILLKAQ